MRPMRSALWFLLVASLIAGACVSPSAVPAPAAPAQATASGEVPPAAPASAAAPAATPAPAAAATAPVMPALDLVLPNSVVAELKSVVNLESVVNLDTHHTVLYALPDGLGPYTVPSVTPSPGPGIAYLLTPAKLQEPQGQLLGALKVVQQLIPELPPDTYAITRVESRISFIGASHTATFPSQLRTLTVPIADDRPVALITSREMCFTWKKTQICAEVPTPLPAELQKRLADAAAKLELAPALVDLNGAVPDVEGLEVINDCQAALAKATPDYKGCTASVLAAPIIDATQVPIPDPTPDTAAIDASTVLAVLRQFTDLVCTDLQCGTTKPGALPVGDYMMYDVVLESDVQLNDTTATQSRVGLSTRVEAEPQLYLPAVVNAPFMGTPVPKFDQEVISNLWKCGKNGKCSCYWRWLQCPGW